MPAGLTKAAVISPPKEPIAPPIAIFLALPDCGYSAVTQCIFRYLRKTINCSERKIRSIYFFMSSFFQEIKNHLYTLNSYVLTTVFFTNNPLVNIADAVTCFGWLWNVSEFNYQTMIRTAAGWWWGISAIIIWRRTCWIFIRRWNRICKYPPDIVINVIAVVVNCLFPV